MSDKTTIDLDGGFFYIAMAVLLIAFWGEPDLVDAIIHALMK